VSLVGPTQPTRAAREVNGQSIAVETAQVQRIVVCRVARQCRGQQLNGQVFQAARYLSLPRLPKSPLFDKIPQAGIWGNDHIMMWDTNSDEIAGILLKWIVRHVGSRKK